MLNHIVYNIKPRAKLSARTVLAGMLMPLLFAAVLYAGTQKEKFTFMNPKLPMEKRVDDLVSRMTLEEKISQLGNESPEIKKLGIKKYNWWNEALHGVMIWEVPVTVFPQAIGLAGSWDPELIGKVASAISDEARAINNKTGKGLTYWSPVVNIGRDPRWGRTQEGYGEDPYLTSRIGVAFVKGLQGSDPVYLKTAATPKHFALNNTEFDRMFVSAEIDDRILYEYYLPHFKACVQEAKAESVMCAYNALNKVPCCANKRLLTDILRDEWGFKGHVVSDCGAIGNVAWTHHYAESEAGAAAAALLAGTDLNCGDTYQRALKDALAQKLVSESDINTAVKRLFMTRFKLGEFDPKELVPYSKIRFVTAEKDIDPVVLVDASGKKQGLTAEYFNGVNFDEKVLERIEKKIDFDWGNEPPAKGCGADNVTVRWTGSIKPQKTGEYKFITYTDDGARLWVDGKQLIDDWKIQATAQNEGRITLEAGKSYDIKMEYYEAGGGAVCRLKWETPGTSTAADKYAVNTAVNRQLSRQAALESIVLLKNEGSLLPLDRNKIKKIAVIGPNADLCQVGNYSGKPVKPVSLLSGLKKKAAEHGGFGVEYSIGCELQSELMKRMKFTRSLDSLFEIKSGGNKGFYAEFFNNKELSGGPVLKRYDEKINFDWKDGSPDAAVNNFDFSCRWIAKIKPNKTAVYWFRATSDDGFKLFIDGKKQMEFWGMRPATPDIAPVTLEAGREYELKMEYFDAGGGAVAKLEAALYEPDPEVQNAAVETAKSCDAVIFAAGLDNSFSEEGNDLEDMNLPEDQVDLLKRIREVNPKVAVVLINGNPLTIGRIKDSIPAIVEAWYPGDEGGNAVADVIFGDYNPGGRLPVTFYKTVSELPDFGDYDIRKGRTYMYMKNEPLFAFGHGLSYTTFEYSGLTVTPSVDSKSGTINVRFSVKNTGSVAGDEVVQLYLKKSVSGEEMPVKELKRFKRVNIKAGVVEEISFDLPVSELSYYDMKIKGFRVEPGVVQVMAGASSADIRLTASFEVLK